MNTDFVPTPNEQEIIRLKSMSVEVTGKTVRGLNQYESVGCTVFTHIEIAPGISNEQIHAGLAEIHELLNQHFVAGIDETRSAIVSGKVSVKASTVKYFLGLPIINDALVIETKTVTLPAPRPMSFAEAGAFTTIQGVKFADLTFDEIDKGIEKLEAALMQKDDLTDGEREVIMTRRDALYCVYNELRRIGPPVENDTLTSSDPNDGALFREAK